MINTFLKAKHWQLFLLTFGLPMLAQIGVMGTIFSNIMSEQVPDLAVILGYMKFFPILIILIMGVFMGWFWSVTIGLQKKIPSGIKMKINRFKIFFIIPIIYMLFILIFIFFIINKGIAGEIDPNMNPPFVLLGGIVLLHLFSMFCTFHTLYFTAKTFKTVELQREVTFSDFIAEFFMLWIYPVGIWIIQPKINKMIEVESLESGENFMDEH